MEQNKVNTFAAKFKKAFSEAVLNELGKATRYCHRVRQLTPYRMVMTLMALFAGTQVESLADLQRGFNALFGYAMDYKPFYDQLAKREFAVFMRETAHGLLETLVIRVLGVASGGAFSEFRRIVIQDGSSFAIKDALKEVFPGRFKKVKPAAVELHATLDLLDESLSKVTLTADTASERAALPNASSLGGCLLLADRGYFDRDYLLELTEAGASFIIRAPKGLNPKVLEAFDAQDRRIPKFVGKPLKTLRIAKRGAVDLRVRWKVQGKFLECRLIVTWNASTREFQYLATNLPPERYSVYAVAKAYRLRWQVGVSSQGHIVQSVEVRPRPKDSGLVAWEAPWRESKTAEPSDNMFRKEHAQRTRLQRTVNVEVASLHVIPVAETVYNARRQQGLDEMSPMRQPSPAGYQRRHGVKDGVSTGETRGVRWGKPTEEASPITVSGKWRRRHPGGGSGRSTYDGRAAKRARREGPGPVSIPFVKVRQG
jgi:hypothetical protein